jgi:hypothetical protein
MQLAAANFVYVVNINLAEIGTSFFSRLHLARTMPRCLCKSITANIGTSLYSSKPSAVGILMEAAERTEQKHLKLHFRE